MPPVGRVSAMTALFAMLQLAANHPQMSYYFFFVMAAMALAFLWKAWRSGDLRRWCAASVVVVCAGMLALGANAPSLYNTYEYSKETKRSQSELTPIASPGDSEEQTRPTGGMPYDQIVGWSYGGAESFSRPL